MSSRQLPVSVAAVPVVGVLTGALGGLVSLSIRAEIQSLSDLDQGELGTSPGGGRSRQSIGHPEEVGIV
jgi:hypothetical protein